MITVIIWTCSSEWVRAAPVWSAAQEAVSPGQTADPTSVPSAPCQIQRHIPKETLPVRDTQTGYIYTHTHTHESWWRWTWCVSDLEEISFLNRVFQQRQNQRFEINNAGSEISVRSLNTKTNIIITDVTDLTETIRTKHDLNNDSIVCLELLHGWIHLKSDEVDSVYYCEAAVKRSVL